MLRRTQRYAGLYSMWRKLTKTVRDGPVGEPTQPFGPDFGLTIIPDYMNDHEQFLIRKQYVDLMMRKSPDIVPSDGRLQLPPFNPDSFEGVVRRLEEDGHTPQGYLNNQTVNFFDEQSFIRAHVDNLFIYDETFAILSLISPCVIRFVHMQTGEELEALIPPNSVYIMEGPARYVYLHYVPPNDLKRVSIVLRRSIFRSSGTFRPVDSRMQAMLPFRANAALDALMTQEIGVPRINVDEKWMAEQRLSAFDTAEMVKRLHPMRDWSLRQQLEEDRLRYDELRRKDYLSIDLDWRFDELHNYFRELDKSWAINADQMLAAEAMMQQRSAAASERVAEYEASKAADERQAGTAKES